MVLRKKKIPRWLLELNIIAIAVASHRLNRSHMLQVFTIDLPRMEPMYGTPTFSKKHLHFHVNIYGTYTPYYANKFK